MAKAVEKLDSNQMPPRKSTRDAEGSIIKRVETRRTSGGKTRKETVFYARCRYTDDSGKKREKKRRAESFADAVIVRRQLREEIKKELQMAEDEFPKQPKTFAELADYYETEYVKEAEYSGNQKVSGLREPIQYVKRHLNLFRQTFDAKRLDRITYDDLKHFKAERLATPVCIEFTEKILLTAEEKKDYYCNRKFRYKKNKKIRPRAIASVHRELERLRRMFNIAVRLGWIAQSPFLQGDPLISHAAEIERVRILSAAEEKRLFAACTGRREHLKAILICALDTCMRKNEIFTLTWNDVNLEKRVITVQALNSKTLRRRFVPISTRLFNELTKLKEITFLSTEYDTVFGIESEPKKSFYSALSEADITDFRFHDLRGTGITRLLRAGMPAAEVMKISGHTQWSTFMRYVKIDDDTVQRAAAAIDDYLNKTQTV